MNLAFVLSAGTRPHSSMPDSSASSRYSMSISSSVSMCSLTNEMGTASMAFFPSAPSARIESSV